MSDAGAVQFTFLFEHEIRTAAKAIRRWHDVHAEGSMASENERAAATSDFINAVSAALWHADDEKRPLILTSAKTLFGPKRKRTNPSTDTQETK